MAATEITEDVEALARRVRQIRELLFGRTRGNYFREFAASFPQTEFCALAKQTYGELVSAIICEDYALAELKLVRIAKMKPHSAVIFLSLDLASLCLMNPQLSSNNHGAWVKSVERYRDNVFTMVMSCVAAVAGMPG